MKNEAARKLPATSILTVDKGKEAKDDDFFLQSQTGERERMAHAAADVRSQSAVCTGSAGEDVSRNPLASFRSSQKVPFVSKVSELVPSMS